MPVFLETMRFTYTIFSDQYILLIQNHIWCIVDKEYTLFTWSTLAFALAIMYAILRFTCTNFGDPINPESYSVYSR